MIRTLPSQGGDEGLIPSGAGIIEPAPRGERVTFADLLSHILRQPDLRLDRATADAALVEP